MEFTVSNKFTNSEHIYLRNCDTHTTEKYIYYEKNSILYSVCVMYIVFCTSIQIVKDQFLYTRQIHRKALLAPSTLTPDTLFLQVGHSFLFPRASSRQMLQKK